ncbi:acetoacetate decarboxylase family protein [Catellatospora tritici]|uniref:acetoacetate decarboxylase family protein n=1 Tax=Catellatospora tritici TaxID=2851566 RepID=UPI001C2DDC1A|nr:acetoacetate decarboxylase family protein [Catellatospora tritici]MBV1852657.1 acetoacetate decarboxylase family protein [Catellatospora tritici]
MAYPPQPWSLRGQLYVSVWAVPVADLPPIPPEVTAAVRLVRLGRYALVGTAWVDYQPGGDMAYRELLGAVLMRAGFSRPRVTITHIWVDSVDSRDGGRELWGIPKDLADFELSDTDAAAVTAGQPIATATIRRSRLALRLPIGFRVTQALNGRALTTPVRARARCGPARLNWQIASDGPLGFLSGRRPLLSLAAADFDMRFGTAAPPPP